MRQQKFEVGKFYIYNKKIFLVLKIDENFYTILLLEKSERQKFVDYFLSSSSWAEGSFPLELELKWKTQ